MQKNFFKKYFLILHIAVRAHVRICMRIAMHIANFQPQPKNTVFMDQISLLKMVWYPNVIDTHRHPIKNYKIFSQPINKQILQHFSAYVKLIATYSNWLCRSKNQSANFQRQKTNKRGAFGLI